MDTTQVTAQDTTPIVISGAEARELLQHITRYVMPNRHWTEVQVMRECDCGCKLYARRTGISSTAPLQFELQHSAAYGCSLGYRESTRRVAVRVDPLG